jgi:hypothetical protein
MNTAQMLRAAAMLASICSFAISARGDETISAVPTKVINSTKLEEILAQGNFLAQMNAWDGKALFVKVDEQKVPIELRYYSFDAIYSDSNQNEFQDEGDAGFFNPASTVKTAIAQLVLERLNELGVSRKSEFKPTQANVWHSVEEDIRKMVILSDNDSTNRLILLLGFDRLNNGMRKKGFRRFSVDRLMLDKGTLVPSPAHQVRNSGRILNLPAQSVSSRPPCFETPGKLGNCAIASELVGVLMRIVRPDFFTQSENFQMRTEDRLWLQETMSKTPAEAGYADREASACRFLEFERKSILGGTKGRLMSKCGVALLSRTYIDSSFIERADGRKYFVTFAVKPISGESKETATRWLARASAFVLPRLP